SDSGPAARIPPVGALERSARSRVSSEAPTIEPVAGNRLSCVSCGKRRRRSAAQNDESGVQPRRCRLAFSGGKRMSPARAKAIRRRPRLVTVACSLLLPAVVIAQQEQAQGPMLQEVIVTATKRAANLQDVPFSVSATSQDQIRNSGAQD